MPQPGINDPNLLFGEATMDEVKRTTPIDRSQVAKVYSGRPGCACGCRGKHSETPRSITLIVNKLNAFIAAGLNVIDDLQFGNVSFQTDSRLYIVYLKEGE